MITPKEKRDIEYQVEMWIINIMANYAIEDLGKVAEIIRNEVDDILESEIDERS